MRITKNRCPIFAPLQLGGTTLEVTAEFSDLGLLTNHKLSWNSHIDRISSKANKVLGLIKSSCRDLRDVSTLRTLYCTLVRSQLEYGSVVWSPFTARNITKLERVQRRTTKFILKTDDDYDVRISKLNLLSLEHRRFLFDVLFLYKVLNGYIDIDMSAYVQFYSDTARYSLREKDSLTLMKNYARTNTFKFSFFNRIVDMWNSLPFYVRSASSISSFKHGVIHFLVNTN